jgi:hypothetical protein
MLNSKILEAKTVMTNRRYIDEIIIHCSATRPEWMMHAKSEDKVEELRRWHVEGNGWSDIGYALVIDRNGSVIKGRDLDKDGDVFDDIGAHTRGKNKTSIGVCLIGGFGSRETDDFLENFTLAQQVSLVEELRDIVSEIPTITKISGHNQYAAKACPGFSVPQFVRLNIPEFNNVK